MKCKTLVLKERSKNQLLKLPYILLCVRLYHLIIISRQEENHASEGRFFFIFMTLEKRRNNTIGIFLMRQSEFKGKALRI
jgi:hypothetical protein